MAKVLTIRKAKAWFPGYDDYPSISVTGSLRGMKKLYGWNTAYVFRIGSWYYNLRGHPNIKNYLDNHGGLKNARRK